jgi:hypothetical protein
MVVYSRLTGYLCKCQATFMLTLEYRTRKQPKNQLLLLKIPLFQAQRDTPGGLEVASKPGIIQFSGPKAN